MSFLLLYPRGSYVPLLRTCWRTFNEKIASLPLVLGFLARSVVEHTKYQTILLLRCTFCSLRFSSRLAIWRCSHCHLKHSKARLRMNIKLCWSRSQLEPLSALSLSFIPYACIKFMIGLLYRYLILRGSNFCGFRCLAVHKNEA